jgi:hypothetical protein
MYWSDTMSSVGVADVVRGVWFHRPGRTQDCPTTGHCSAGHGRRRLPLRAGLANRVGSSARGFQSRRPARAVATLEHVGCRVLAGTLLAELGGHPACRDPKVGFAPRARTGALLAVASSGRLSSRRAMILSGAERMRPPQTATQAATMISRFAPGTTPPRLLSIPPLGPKGRAVIPGARALLLGDLARLATGRSRDRLV